MVRIFMRPEVIPGPAEKAAVTHARDKVGHEVVAERVALVGRAPEIASQRVYGETHAVAKPACEHALASASGIERQHRGAIGLVAPRAAQAVLRLPARDRRHIAPAHALADIRRGADRNEHLPVVLGKRDVAGDMAALPPRPPAPARLGTITSALPRAATS